MWDTWSLVQSIIEPLQTGMEDEGEDNDQGCRNQKESSEENKDLEETPEHREKDFLEAPTVVPKLLHPPLGDCLGNYNSPTTPLPQSPSPQPF